MILKLKEYHYGYELVEDENISKEWENLIKEFQKQNKLNCIICNSKTSEKFRIWYLGQNITTINNKIKDNVVFLNFPH